MRLLVMEGEERDKGKSVQDRGKELQPARRAKVREERGEELQSDFAVSSEQTNGKVLISQDGTKKGEQREKG